MTNRICNRCGTELDKNGWCKDDTCPHSDWPQTVDIETEVLDRRHEDIIDKLGDIKRKRNPTD